MVTVNSPQLTEPPSARKLVRSTLIAFAVALAILVVAVLPAEYGIDPTGVGRILGLTQMGEIKTRLAKEAAADAAADAQAAAEEEAAAAVDTSGSATADSSAQPMGAATSRDPSTTEETRVTLKPGASKEVKLVMRQGARASYSWATENGVVNFSTHGDSANAPRGWVHEYGKGTGSRSDEGVLVAAFNGMHGWFWRNRTDQVVTVILRTSGDYQALKQMQ
jgi:hypothetical protein